MAAHINDRRLYRSRSERMISGVCGGLGDYFGIDPVIVRLAFALVTLAGGAGLLAYIILALVVPEEPVTGATTPRVDGVRAAGRGRELGGLILLGAGLYFVARNLGWMDWLAWFNWGAFWPLILVALGVAILLRRDQAA